MRSRSGTVPSGPCHHSHKTRGSRLLSPRGRRSTSTRMSVPTTMGRGPRVPFPAWLWTFGSTRSCPPRRRRAPLRCRRADGGPEACVVLPRRSVLDLTRRRGCPSRDDAIPQGSGEREKGRHRPRRGWRRRARRERLSCGGSIRRESGGRHEEHREVPWCDHHAPTESLPHPLPPAELKRKLRGRANRRVTFRIWRLSGRSNRGFITR